MATSQLTIAILTPGQMGSSFARLFLSHPPALRPRVVTNLHSRSSRTKDLARESGIEDLGSDERVLNEADIVLSVLVPDKALELAQSLAKAASSSSVKLKYFVELNAISPTTLEKISSTLTSSIPTLAVIDGGIIGGPANPTTQTAPLIVLSGPATPLSSLDKILAPLFLNRTKVVGDKLGQASALKLTYASLSKGATALVVNAAVLAEKYGVADSLKEELARTNPHMRKVMEKNLPRDVAKAFRWVGEMDEIGQTYRQAGLEGGGRMFEGAAKTYEFVAANDEVGKESVEQNIRKGWGEKETVEALLRGLDGV
ncbi:6-phosphogluconate dehydrogenase C-terminal domain-like protein [Meredithblackwellia eburnea MCA 4105]